MKLGAGEGLLPIARKSEDESGPENVCDVVLATLAMWVEKVPAREAETLALKFFAFDKLKAAASGVKPYTECTILHGEQPEVLARNLVAAVTKLCQCEDPKVVFLVRSLDLFSVPGVESSLMPLDASAIGARLLGMEASMEAVSTSLKGIANLEKSVETLASVVTSLQEQQRHAPATNSEAVQQVHPVVQQANKSYAAVVGNAANQTAGGVVGTGAGDQRRRKRGATGLDSPHQETPRRPNPVTPPSALFQEALAQNRVQGVSQMLRDERKKSEQDGFTLAHHQTESFLLM